MLAAPDAGIVRRDQGLPGLAVLLDTAAFLEVLSGEFPFVNGTAATIQYLRYKPGTSCLCSYRISSPAGALDVYAKASRPGRSEKLRHWRRDAQPAWSGHPRRRVSEPWHLGISLFPDDRRLKALEGLHDPSTRDRVLVTAFGRHPGWRRGYLATLRYKPERRYVASLVADGAPAAVLKLYDRTGYAEAHARARVFATREVLRVPACVGESAGHHLLGFEWMSGCTLDEELTRPGGLGAAELAGLALAELHGQDVPPLFSPHRGASARAVHAAAESVATVCPQLAARARSLADRIAARLDESSGSEAPAHGDFYAGQVIVTGGAAAFLDFDRACQAPAALDLGTWAAHLRRAVLRGVHSHSEAEDILQAFLHGYSRRAPMPAAAQLGAYTAAALVRLAPEPFRRHEADWARATEAILEEAARSLAPAARDRDRSWAVGQAARSVIVDDPPGLSGDPAWGFLRPALDPSEARRQLHAPLARLGAADAELREIRVSRHKPNRRCVVEYTFEADTAVHPNPPLVVLGKSRIKGLNTNAHQALDCLWNAGFRPPGSSICVPQPLGTVPAWRMTLQRKVQGDPASERLAEPDGAVIAARIAEAIFTLHTRGVAPVRQHTVEDELRILRERLSRLDGRAGASRVQRLLYQCERLAAQVPRCEPRPIHRDFYPAHVLVDGDRLWLIDLDLYCAGDPGLDVGNFLAHMIEERLRRDGWAEELTRTESAFESRYVQLAGRPVLPAIRAYTTLSLVRHVHLSTQFPDRHHTTQALLDLCERLLSVELESRLRA